MSEDLGKAELIGGPFDGTFERKEICTKCGDGEVMDIYGSLPGDSINVRHQYIYHECDNTFVYRGQVTIDLSDPEWFGI